MKQNGIASQVSIIGLGNVLLGDDGFGCLTVEVFRSRYECGPEVEISDLGTPGLDLAPYLYGKELVVIVDAVNADGEPGTVRVYGEDEFSDSTARIRLTDHDPGLAESLAQLRLAGRAPSEVIVVGVIPESCGFGEGISSIVLAASSVAIDNIFRLLLEHGFDCRRRPHPVQPKLWWVDRYTAPTAQNVSRECP
jgi:hydrogenase maturation protease